MLPCQKSKFAEICTKRKQHTKIKRKIQFTILLSIFLIAIIYYAPNTLSSAYQLLRSPFIENTNNHVIANTNARHLSSSGYPPDTFEQDELTHGAWILYFVGMLYMFVGIALLCDEWFVPAIEVIVEQSNMTPDTAGATWMAAGGSAPELFTSVIGTFLARSNVGFGTIVGSAVFNVLFVIGCCAIFTPGHLPLTWWPFARDCFYYMICLSILAIFFGGISPSIIEWWEALILLLLYLGYVMIMRNNQQLHDWFFKKYIIKKRRKSRATSAGSQREAQLDTGTKSGIEKEKEKEKEKENENKNESPENEDDFLAGINFDSEIMEYYDQPRKPIHFNASLFAFLVKDTTILDLAGLHVVSCMRGEAKEAFSVIDSNGDGHIDRAELRQLLFTLGDKVTEENVTLCFAQIDSNDDGQISFQEFEDWYMQSEIQMTNDIKRIFSQFDRNNDGCIDVNELESLITLINDGVSPTQEELEQAFNAITGGQTLDLNADYEKSKISDDQFVKWWQKSKFFEQKRLKRQATLKRCDSVEIDGIDLTFPEGLKQRILYCLTAPLVYTLYYSLKDVQKEKNKEYWLWTFAGSIMWLAFFSYLMVWWATMVGKAWGVPDEVMGLTFLAAGTSVPDLLSSVIVAKMGEGDMAVSSSIGSNIFDILIGLPFPWIVFCFTFGAVDGSFSIVVDAESLGLSIVVLILMLMLVLVTIMFNNWKMTHALGYTMFLLWILFVVQDLLRQLVFPEANLF